MAQRFSGRVRQDREHYPTPAWTTEALLPHLGPERRRIWEPACGEGQMADVLACQHDVIASDIAFPKSPRRSVWPFYHCSFLHPEPIIPDPDFDGIVTNPPYGIGGKMAVAFIERALELTQHRRGFVAMLLKVDFDSAKGRRHLFRDNRAWAKKIVLTDRILWFESDNGMQPSENHSWFCWDFRHSGPPVIAYEGKPRAAKIENEAA